MQVKSFIEYYHKQIRIAYLILFILVITINVLDLFILAEVTRSLLFINLGTITILLLTLFLYLSQKLSLTFCITFLLYTTLANLFASAIFNVYSEIDSLDYLMRETFFLILMIFFSGLFINRVHVFSVLAFLLFRYISLTFEYEFSFLIENIYILLLTFIALTSVVYFLSGKLHQSIVEIQVKQNEIIQKNEALAQKNKALQKMNTSKDKFFAIISHDLKNPLNALSGFIELMRVRKDKLDEEKKASYLGHMQTTVDVITELLDDLLEWSRTQSNQITYKPANFEVKALATTVCYYLKQVAEIKEITLIDKTEVGQEAYADFNMLFTVIRNLVSNAIKFSHKGSSITILAEDVRDKYRMKVVDEGVGIKPDDLSKLFVINETYSTQGTNGEKGTGLGLVLSKEFVEKNGGTIGVESEPGKGTTFWFTFPKQKA